MGGSAYIPGTVWVPTSGISLADAAPASVLDLVSTDEAALDRTEQFTMSKWRALGGESFVSNNGRFAVGALDRPYLSISTSVDEGDTAKIALPNLVHGAVLTGVDLLFVPSTGHADLPATPPKLDLIRWSRVVGSVPSFGDLQVIGSVTYTPVSLVDYEDGRFKVVSLSSLAHTVDATGYGYQLLITDEDDTNAQPGGRYYAFRLTYGA